jgi:Ca2+-binding EF-hand superfamily protein
MHTKRFMVWGVVVLLFAAAAGWTQFPGGNDNGGGRGGGGFRGGRGIRGGDPNAFFDMLARGKEVVNRADLDLRMQSFFDRIAANAGITNGQITRQQFVESMQQRAASRPGGPDLGAAAAPGAPGARDAPRPGGPEARGARGGWNPADFADRLFRRQDQNGDGLLNFDEMPEALRQERDKWDANKDGFIDPTEFRAYMQARMQQSLAERGWPGLGPNGEGAGTEAEAAPIEEERRPVVHRVGKLPKELPPWFAQLDTDRDAQVGLYEWKESGRPLDEFLAMDRNNDGFLTVDEVLRYVAQAKNHPPDANGSTSPGRFPTAERAPGVEAAFGGDPAAFTGGSAGAGERRFGGGMRGRGGRGNFNRGDFGGGPGGGGGRGRGVRNRDSGE